LGKVCLCPINRKAIRKLLNRYNKDASGRSMVRQNAKERLLKKVEERMLLLFY